MVKNWNIDEFLAKQEAASVLVLDVRSPGEFEKGHMPGAKNFPLFENAERAVVGTLYKQQGREEAVQKGLEIVGPKLAPFIEQAKQLCPDKKMAIHCWRGGMRSKNMALLFSTSGFEVDVIKGGYKAYRQHIREQFAHSLKLIVLAGETGSGKTEVLQELAKQGEQVLDLEGFAHHKGSAFGGLMQEPQPTTEQFENNLHAALVQLDPQRPIWVEDESMAIGKLFIPMPFWKQMEQAPTVQLVLPLEARIQRLVREYSEAEAEELAQALHRIRKRLGGQHVKAAEEALANQDYERGAAIALRYYDKTYRYAMEKRKREPLFRLEMQGDNPALAAELLKKRLKALPNN